jgi:hypothetical protein
MEHLSLRRSSVRGSWRGFLFWGPWSYVKRALEREHLPVCRDSVRGTWRRGFLSGDFERQVERALEMEHLSRCRSSIRGPGGSFFSLVALKDNGAWEETSALAFA